MTANKKYSTVEPYAIWHSGPGGPTLRVIENRYGTFDIAVGIDGGYANFDDAVTAAYFWAGELNRGGLTTRIDDIRRWDR